MAADEEFGRNLSVNKKDIAKQHRSNKQASYDLKPGYIPIDSDFRFQKTGIRGHKKYLFYLVVAILFVIALGNLLTTFVLLGVIRLGYGAESFEFFPSGRLLRFLTPTEFLRLVPLDGCIGGFSAENLDVVGKNQPIIMEVNKNKSTSISVNIDETTFNNVDLFRIIDPNTGRQIFSTEYTEFGLPNVIKNLKVHQVQVARVTSPMDQSLMVYSASQIRIRGNEAFRMASKEIVMGAGEDIFLESMNASTIIDGKNGIFIPVNTFPRAAELKEQGRLEYKICVCMPSGQLFRIPLQQQDYNCDNVVISGKINPCL